MHYRLSILLSLAAVVVLVVVMLSIFLGYVGSTTFTVTTSAILTGLALLASLVIFVIAFIGYLTSDDILTKALGAVGIVMWAGIIATIVTGKASQFFSEAPEAETPVVVEQQTEV